MKLTDLYFMGKCKAMRELEKRATEKGLGFKWEVAWDIPKVDIDKKRLKNTLGVIVGRVIKTPKKVI